MSFLPSFVKDAMMGGAAEERRPVGSLEEVVSHLSQDATPETATRAFSDLTRIATSDSGMHTPAPTHSQSF